MQELIEISKKKPNYVIQPFLTEYLTKYDRTFDSLIEYNDLLRFRDGIPLIDINGNDTLWMIPMYDPSDYVALQAALTRIYSYLTTDGEIADRDYLKVDRIDYCTFGNSKPFRIRIINTYNDNYDYFYVKKADASRVYGLEFEHLLSPNRINYLVDGHTLIEEHIPGIPGDAFIDTYLESPTLNKVRLAKEFVKFNERCFVRLLGDMRSYNYVVNITPDFDAEQYRVRAIDFDQQSYEGRKNNYLPQFYKENLPIVKMCTDLINPRTAYQYQLEERTLIARRLRSAKKRNRWLFSCLDQDSISKPEKIDQLSKELAKHHDNAKFKELNKMGELIDLHLQMAIRKL